MKTIFELPAKKMQFNYFYNKELAAKFLNVDTVRDIFIVNLLQDFSEDALTDAFNEYKETWLCVTNDVDTQVSYCNDNNVDHEDFTIDDEDFLDYCSNVILNVDED
jgi:hypothetical protein